MSEMQDMVLVCRDCGNEFAFTKGEQTFYEEKEFENPQRCPECRRIRKQKRREEQGYNNY